MSRISPVHYIAPSAVSIMPNANETADDLAISVTSGAKIKVYCPRAGLGTVNSQYLEWTLAGRNRRLSETDKPYTIYARLSKYDKARGYLIFAAKNGSAAAGWTDKYNYLTADSAYASGITNISGATVDTANWYVRMGDVSLPENGRRTLTFDTGVLGTDLFNNDWALNPDTMPLRIEFACTVNGQDAGPTPYVYWGQTLVLNALLTEGWTGTDIQRFDHWEIVRDTGNTQADAAWAATVNAGSFRSTGTVNLVHGRGTGSTDDFNGVVNATFIVHAMENTGTQESPVYTVLKSASICIMAETWETYGLSMSSDKVTYNPITRTYSPAGGIDIKVRATDQKSETFLLTNKQVHDAGLVVEYATVDASQEVWTALTFSGVDSAVASANIPTNAFAQNSLNVRLRNAAQTELYRTTIAFLRDGEDSKEREWIFLRSATEIAFGDAASEHPLPSLIAYGEVNPTGAAGHITNDKNQDDWVPEGWYDEQLGVSSSYPYEYGAYRDFVHESGNTPAHWGDFSTPKIWNHWGRDGQDAWVFDLDNEMDSVSCDDTGVVVGSDQTINTTGRLFKGTTRKAFYLYGGITRNGVAFTYDSANDKFVYGNEIELWRDATDANIFHIKYKVGAVISGKDDIAIGIQAQDDASVIYTGHITVNGVVGDVYNLLPAQNELHGWKSQDGHYYIGNLNNFQFLTCGYKKKVNGVVTEYNNVTGQIDGKYNIYFRLHQRANNIWDTTYYLYTARSTVSQFYLDAYDGIEYILCTNTSYDTTTPTNVIDREEVWILSDGSAGKDAAEVRPNLLKQTQFINGQMNQWYQNDGEIIVNGFDGHNTIHLNLNNTIGQYVQGAGHEVLEPATVYTISFWSKGVIFIDLNPGDTGEAYAVFDRTFGRWIDGVKESDYVNDFGYIWEDSDWTYHTYTFKTAASFDGSLANLYWHSPNWYTGSTGCYLCVPKLERGDTATAYLANEWDTRGIVSTNIYYTAAASTAAPQTPSGAPIPSGWVDNGNNLIKSGNAALHLYESTCTTYSDGTYSWTTPLDDGLISDMAATEEEFGLSDSSNTPPSSWRSSQQPTAGKWIWSRTVLTYVGGGTTYIPNVNGQCIGYCGTNGRTPEKGVDYSDGADAWSVAASPSPLIINQNIDNASDFGLPIEINFTGKCGDNTATVGTVNTTNSMGLGITPGSGKITITSYSKVNGAYVTSGVIVCTVPLSYGSRSTDFAFRISVGVNMIGQFSDEIKGDMRTELAQSTLYKIEDGVLVEEENWGEFYRSSTENISRITKQVNNGKNMLSLTNGWEGYQGAAVTYDNKNFGVRNANGNLYSPVFLGVEGETYCFSVYIASGYYLSGNPGYCYSSTQPTHASDIDDNGVYQSASFIEVTGDTITIGSTTYQRYYFLIPGSVVKERYFTIYNDGNYWFYCPQLEVGNTPSAFAAGSIETTSQIKQTANEIDASVRDDLGETGININGNNKTITLKGEHVVFQNSAGNLITPKISIDPNTGALHAVDGDFSGSVSVGNGGLTCSVNNGKQTIVFEETARGANEIWYGFAATSVVDDLYSGDILSLGGRINTTTGAGYGRLLLEEVAVGNTEPVVLYETELLPGGCIFRKDSTGKTLEFGFFDGYGDRLWIHAPKAQWREYSSGLRDGVVYVDTQYGILRVSGYNDSSLPWGGGGGGTVTSITAGTGLSGGTITGSGTISISSTYQTYISNGNTAYGWGDHRQAGYLTSVAFSNLTSHPTSISGYGITDAYISGGTIYLGSNSITPLSNDMGQNYLYFTNSAYLKYTLNDRDSVLDIACQDNIHIDSGSNVTIEADSDINIESDYQVNITGGDTINITGADAINITSTTDEIRLNASAGVYVTGNLRATGFAEIDSYISTGGNVLRTGLGTFYVGWNDNGGINNSRPHIEIGDDWVFVKNHNPSNNSTPRNYFGLDSDGWFVCKFYDCFYFQDTNNNNKTILEYDINDADILKCYSEFDVDGDCYADSFIQNSDVRLKNIISDVNINIYNVANAPIFKFTWKDGKGENVHIGTSAQYWQTVLSETVSRKKDGMLAMQYDVAALAAAVITAKTVAGHEDRITILERENDALKNRIKELENTIFIN